MIGHQRDILATLGIDIWVPKEVLCQNLSAPSIWRDQSVAEVYSSEIIVEQNHSAIPLIATIAPVPLEPLDHLKAEKTATASVSQEQPSDQVTLEIETLPLVQIAPFQLQALGLPHCVIVADVTEISTEQQQLWHNLQQAFQSDYYELQWPFPLINFQDGRGAESYVKGFVDAIALEKSIIFLGSSLYAHGIEKIDFSNLQEMLDQPLLKQQLWQKICELKKNMDMK